MLVEVHFVVGELLLIFFFHAMETLWNDAKKIESFADC